MTSIDLHQNLIRLSRPATARKAIIFDILMRVFDPGSTVRSKRSPIHEECGLSSRLQVHDDPAPVRRLRQYNFPAEPGIFPGPSPGHSGGCRFVLHLACFSIGQLVKSAEVFHRDLSQRKVKIILKNFKPLLYSVLIF